MKICIIFFSDLLVFLLVLLSNTAQVLCTAHCALHLHFVKYCARRRDGANQKICLYNILVPMLCALQLWFSVLFGSSLGKVPWARLLGRNCSWVLKMSAKLWQVFCTD